LCSTLCQLEAKAATINYSDGEKREGDKSENRIKE
jgi:hypothetical protein